MNAAYVLGIILVYAMILLYILMDIACIKMI